MKKVFLLLAVIAINFISYGQDGFQPIKAEMKANEFKGNIGLLQKACSNTLNISTPTNWVSVGSVPTSVKSFYNHPNWIAITTPQAKTYQFKRAFYIGRAGTYKISVKGMGDNRMVLNVDVPANLVFDKDVTDASGFNTPTSAMVDVELTCGIHELNVTIINYGTMAGFYLDGNITSKDVCVSDEKLNCEIVKDVCKCPEGWRSDDSPYSKEFRCGKMLCKLEIKPLPKNDTRIGEWGFTWGDGIWVYGTKENGGFPICKKEWVVEGTNPNTKAGEGREEK